MKVSTLGFGLIAILVLAVAFAGCSGTSTAPSTPSGGQAAAGGASSGLAGGDQLFGGVSYNWVEYKTTSGAGGQQMIIYTKWTKEGKCTMRFEGAGAEQIKGMMPTEMDCSSTGGQTQQQSNPNQVSPDIKFVKVSTETVTVPAGTFTADKYTATYQGMTSTYWIAGGKPLLKMEGGSAESKTVMELNGWG